ncbi:MAG: ribulose-phosphate 3-epimerase [Clostridia bacterium]|nr:ribulose-phosphate 3-epimerase [Clostridia bacterium]
MIKISPSVLACDFAKLGEEVESIAKAGADMVHLDVMDGSFVTNISFGLPVIQCLRKHSDMFFDVHLMIDEPIRYVARFADAGADLITVHAEARSNVTETLLEIQKTGKKVGLSVKPNTPIESIYPYLSLCDMILVMTVEPGYGGQALIPETLDKVALLKEELCRRGLSIDIQVDGGINAKNAEDAKRAGANVLVAGSSVFGASDRGAAIASLKKEI